MVRFDLLHPVQHALGVTVRRVDNEDVDPGTDQARHALFGIPSGPYGGTYPQRPKPSFEANG
ncbi:MAG: hypothetical protein CM1200mP36_03160 [Gammaproteobacteria bacterium]|nr:MAG: hypothetical protein CM1200mP36_03160 [Gammaproteobacteria bacterium]